MYALACLRCLPAYLPACLPAQVLALTYTFLVTVILLNLLVAVMSDTYRYSRDEVWRCLWGLGCLYYCQ